MQDNSTTPKEEIRRKRKPGISRTPTYRSWYGMQTRCYDPQYRSFHRYGGRGIIVCPRWLIFENFLADMGERPPGTSIDRINNDGNYEPDNCKWSNQIEQNNNTSQNQFFTYKGETLTIAEWARKYDIPMQRLHSRLRNAGWDIEKALTTPRLITREGREQYTFNGVTSNIFQLAKLAGLRPMTVYYRIKDHGWTVEKALTTPIQYQSPNGQAVWRKKRYKRQR